MLGRLRSLLADSEAGSVLIVTMMIVMIAGGLTIVVLSSSMLTNRDSGVDRQRTIAVNAAESGIDASYASIQASNLNLPCTYPASGTNNVSAYPDPTAVQATITYYDANHNPLPCPLNGAVPASALIKSTATTPALAGGTNTGVRTMEAYVNLKPVYGNGFNNAIFGNTTIFTGNQSTINKNPDGTTADLYSNGNVICSNNETFQGSVYAPNGYINFDNGCSATVAGDLWASGTVTTQSNVTINGRVISSGSNVSLSGNTSVGQTVIANGTISWSGCSASKNNCLAKMSTAAPPAQSQQFPALRGDSATTSQWASAGYQVITASGNDCNNQSTLVNRIQALASGTTPTLYEVPTSCLGGAVQFSKTTITYNSNFALFAYGGISTTNQVNFVNGSATKHNVYMVVPYDAVSSIPCTSPGISTTNQFSIDSTLNILWYTPCNISLSQNTSTNMQGQIYSGSQVTVGQNMSMTFVNTNPIGIDPSTLPTIRYTVDILYKRETH